MRKQQHKQPSAERRLSAVEAMDRRRAPRAMHRVMFMMRPVTPGCVRGPAVEVILQDLSISGMGIIHTDAMAMGDQYEIPLVSDEAAGGGTMVLLATVVRCERLDDELFNIGFEFNSSVAVVDEGSRQLTGQPAPRD